MKKMKKGIVLGRYNLYQFELRATMITGKSLKARFQREMEPNEM